MQISVVIPTRNRRPRLLELLGHLTRSSYPIHEVVIVDASDVPLDPADFAGCAWPVRYLRSESSVCLQRNTGIRAAAAPWIFLCDDDIEVPPDYLQQLTAHIETHPEAGAVSGVVRQRRDGGWTGEYTIRSRRELVLKYIFGLSLWGRIECTDRPAALRRILAHYARKGNHISRAGWPVITDCSGDHYSAPVYGLGASLVRRDWLLESPYDEVLDRHGIGDNYGVALGFPAPGIRIVGAAFVYHHHEQVNRLQAPLTYYRRCLALDYFIRTKPGLNRVSRIRFLWSLLGNALIFLLQRNGAMAGPAFRTFVRILAGRNPYYAASRRGGKVIEPVLS